jgi:hypothetical protein
LGLLSFTAWVMPPALFDLFILETESCFLPILYFPQSWQTHATMHWDGVSQTFLPWLACAQDPPNLPHSWDHRYMSLHLAVSWDEVLWTYFPRLASNHDLPHLHLK